MNFCFFYFLLRIYGRLEAVHRQLRTGFAVDVSSISLGMRMAYCYWKAETKTSPVTSVLRGWCSTRFWELTHGFIFSVSAAGILKVVWRYRQSWWFYGYRFSSIDYQYYRIYDALVYGKENHHSLRLERESYFQTSNALGLNISSEFGNAFRKIKLKLSQTDKWLSVTQQ